MLRSGAHTLWDAKANEKRPIAIPRPEIERRRLNLRRSRQTRREVCHTTVRFSAKTDWVEIKNTDNLEGHGIILIESFTLSPFSLDGQNVHRAVIGRRSPRHVSPSSFSKQPDRLKTALQKDYTVFHASRHRDRVFGCRFDRSLVVTPAGVRYFNGLFKHETKLHKIRV